MTPENITKRSSENRRSNKPIMEKRRRARINNSLNELKSLILDATKKDPARHSKLEKADILEMTVKHFENLHRQMIAMAVVADPSILNKYRAGFNECANEVSRFLNKTDGLETQAKQRLLGHLTNCINGVTNNSSNNSFSAATSVITPLQLEMTGNQALPTTISVLPQPTSEALQGVFSGFQLVPTRLSNGDLAFILPSPSKTVRSQSQTVAQTQTNFECKAKTPQPHISFEGKVTSPQTHVNFECQSTTPPSQISPVCNSSAPQSQITHPESKSVFLQAHSTFKCNSTSQTNITCKPAVGRGSTIVSCKPTTQVVQPQATADCQCTTFQPKRGTCIESVEITAHPETIYNRQPPVPLQEQKLQLKPLLPQPPANSARRPVYDEMQLNHGKSSKTKVNTLTPTLAETLSPTIDRNASSEVQPNLVPKCAPVAVAVTSSPSDQVIKTVFTNTRTNSAAACYASRPFPVSETKSTLHMASTPASIKPIPDRHVWRPW